MNLAVSLWRLFQADRLVRWASYASVVVIWFAVSWVEIRILLGIPVIGVVLWWLRRQRERHGWLSEPEIDIDLL
jgi:hypothetical protein